MLGNNQKIREHWHPHETFKTFSKKAHIAALRPHIGNRWFASIDLESFFEHVTRAKVHRAIENIGFSRTRAFRIAGESTVRQNEKYSLARGFPQSAVLATLVLDRSLFGSYLRKRNDKSALTIYSDDIILSSNNFQNLVDEYWLIIELLGRSNFSVNTHKSQPPNREVVVFNIRLSHKLLRFTDERMWRFFIRAKDLLQNTSSEQRDEKYQEFFGRYVASINSEQARQLAESLGVSAAT
ncbi:reverse transcriptase domain-containing protein [Rhodovulum sp. PH10]|uniref:reverse transcriptase domain-containing protein n=1 Tax=Rhodovulum sp. PH10 TaxID=1187851 RepID=UPI0012FAD219|nr:reverse transcriptase domain-containing protein [Rhodovulum sp. PH10]